MQLLFSIASNADTYTSVAAGGNWSDPATWGASSIPTQFDDVVIAGPGTVYLNGNYICASLTVNATGVFQNSWNQTRVLDITGDVTNNGTIDLTNYSFTLNISGNLINNAIMTNSHVNFIAGTTQYISCGAGQEIACTNLTNTDNSSAVVALTDITFNGTQIDFNNGQLVLPIGGGATLTLHGGYLYRTDLDANSGTLYMDNGAYIHSYVVTHDAVLAGNILIRHDNVTFEGETINNGTLSNYVNYNVYWCNIDGNITNNGTITEPNYNLYLRCNGNITNNGTWENNYTYMTSYNSHELRQGGVGKFAGENFIAADTTGMITVMTDFTFENSWINLNGKELTMDLSMDTLTIINHGIYGGTLYANGRNLKMNSTNNEGYLQSITIENPVLCGVVRLRGTGVVFNGNTVIEGTLINRTNENATITVNELITNNGVIQTSNYSLSIDVNGNIVNNGTWTNNLITMTSGTDQYISCINGKAIAVAEINDSENASVTILNGKVTFSGTNVNLTDGRLDCAGNELEFINSARINNSEIEDALITGTMYVDNNNVRFYGTTTNNGVIRNFDNENIHTYIYGDIINNGSILKSNYDLNIYFYADIFNYGTWAFSEMHMASNNIQYLTLDPAHEFNSNYLYNDDPLSSINALTNLTFNGTNIDFNNGQMILPVSKGGSLTLHGGYLYEIDLITNSGSLIMDNGAVLWDQSIINNATLEGTVIVRADPVIFKGETINNGILMNPSNINIYWCYIDGNLTNNGTIQNSNYNFHLRCNENITNNGIWSNYYTEMMSYNTHEIFQGGTGEFTGEYFYAADTTGTIYIMTDFNFVNTKINLNGVTMEIDYSKGANLSVLGGYLFNGTCLNHGQEIYLHNEAYLQGFTLHDAVLKGIVRIHGNGVVFNGNTIVEDTLQTRTNVNSTITVNDSLTNNGVIRNSNYDLNMNVTGGIVNNGEWTNTILNMTGTADQHIICKNNEFISTESFFNSDPASSIISTGDLLFSGTNVDLNSGTLIMPSAAKLAVLGTTQYNGYLYNGTVSGEDFEYEGNSGAYIHSVVFEPNVILLGEVHLSSNATYNGYIINTGILRSRVNTNSTLYVGGRITNNGQLINGNFNLYIYCQGDIVNNGTWSNTRTNLNGTSDQFVFLIDHQPITGQFQFDALSLGAPYQWYYEGAMLNSPDFAGETAQVLSWNVPVQQLWYGDYYCQTGGGDSRNITVGGGLLANFSVFLEGPFTATEMSTSLNSNGYLPLSQPYGGSPWNYIGTESVVAIPNGNVVDWVLVEYRVTPGGPENATAATMVAQQAAFLLKDGRIVGMDGENELQIDISITDNLYIVIWHRNHLSVMTSANVTQDGAAYTWDFRDDIAKAYLAEQGFKDLGGGNYGMIAGDGDGNKLIQNSDESNVWRPELNQSGYKDGDFNLDGLVQNTDETNYWKPNLNLASQVPN